MIELLVNEQELINAAKAGDREAFGSLVAEYLPFVRSLAMNIVFNEMDADDVTQEVFISAFRSLDTFRGDAKFRTWLYRITVNQALQMRKRFRRHTTESIDTFTEQLQDTSADTMQSSLNQSRSRILRKAVDRLPPKQRLVLLLRLEHDLKFQEIADVMQRSVGAVKANYFQGVQKLQKYLNPEDV